MPIELSRYTHIRRVVSEYGYGNAPQNPGVYVQMLRELLNSVTPEVVTLNHEHKREINRLIGRGAKLAAIKYFKDLTGVGLMDSKRFIESLMDGEDKKTKEIRWKKAVTKSRENAASILGENGPKPRLRHRVKPKKRKKSRVA